MVINLKDYGTHHVICSKTSATLNLTCCRIQFNTASGAIEMITVINFSTESQWSSIDESMTLLARILANLWCLNICIASMTQSSILISYEARVGQLFSANLAAEAFWMPAGLHCLNYASDDNVTTLVAIWCKQNTKIFFAVLSAFEFIEDPILERAETLSTSKIVKNYEMDTWFIKNNLHKALNVPQLSIGVDNFFLGFKAFVAPSAAHRIQAHVAGWYSKI